MNQTEVMKSIGFPQTLHDEIAHRAKGQTRTFPQQVRHMLNQQIEQEEESQLVECDRSKD